MNIADHYVTDCDSGHTMTLQEWVAWRKAENKRLADEWLRSLDAEIDLQVAALEREHAGPAIN